MYSVSAYGRMISDAPRMEAYVSALRSVVKPGSVVVDLGSGPGIMALTACQLGARRVYAIEPDNIIQIAREAAVANGLSDRIEFIQDFSTNVSLPESADVIVSDLRGVLPWFKKHIASIRDARNRFLSPNGVLVPRRDFLWAAIVEVPERYAELMAPWEVKTQGFDLAGARRRVTNTWVKSRIRPDDLLVSPVCWHTIDYNEVLSPDVSAAIAWSVNRSGTAHGLSLWFDSDLIEGVHFSNRPGEPEMIYGNALFLLTQPVEVAVGDVVNVSIRGDLIGHDYVWGWQTRIFCKGNSDHVKANFRQSSFFGDTFSQSELRKRAANYVPLLNDEGEIQEFVLSSMHRRQPLKEIAAELSQRFPSRFSSANEALNIVGELSIRFSTQEKQAPKDP